MNVRNNIHGWAMLEEPELLTKTITFTMEMVQMISKEMKKKAKKIVKNKPQNNFYSSRWCNQPAQTNQQQERDKKQFKKIDAQHTHNFLIRIKN